MKTLNNNWLTEGLIDFEYKKYIVLAYLQSIKEEFGEKKLYPFFSDLLFHYQNLVRIKENQKLLYESFPKQISHADFQKLELTYKSIVADDVLMREIEDVIYFSLPQFADALEKGRELYDFVSGNMEISPVGLLPVNREEGYFFLLEFNDHETKVFHYQVSIFESAAEKYRGISTVFVESIQKSIGQTFENIKVSLLRKYRNLPNPATFAIISQVPCPLNESLLPIAKRNLVKYLSTQNI